MKCKKLILVGVASLAMRAVAVEPTVTDVTAKQRYPWNGMVDITCTVSGISGATNDLKFSVAAVNSGKVHGVSKLWVVRDGTNSTDRAVHTNGTYHLIWDSKADFDKQTCSNMVVRVNLDIVDLYGKVQLWEGGPYWATTNIGAGNPWDYGYYFRWGDTVGYKYVDGAWVASDGSSTGIPFIYADYVPEEWDVESLFAMQDGAYIVSQGSYVLAPAHDAAYVHWGGRWRMPTYVEFDDLRDKCDWEVVTMNGVKGCVVRGRGAYATNSIFLPAAGSAGSDGLYDDGSSGCYWSSSTIHDFTCDFDFALSFSTYDNKVHFDTCYWNWCCGMSVRPVQAGSEAQMTTITLAASDSAPFRLDTTQGTRVAKDVESITYSTAWENGEKLIVSVDDVTLKEASAPASGDVTWYAAQASDGIYLLTHTIYNKGVAVDVETASFLVQSFIVTFDANGGNGGLTKSVKNGAAIGGLPTPTRSGCSFNGWWTAASGGSQISAETKVSGNVTYYARWVSTVTFDVNGGSGDSTRIVDYGAMIGTLPIPTRSGCSFNGWWTAASGGSQISAETKVNANVTYYAHWCYTVAFNANGGSGGSTRNVEIGAVVGTLPTPTRNGHTFDGWWTAASGGSQISAETKVNANVTYYAHWCYTVAFNANGGSGGSTRNVEIGAAVGTLPTPTRNGHTFDGWWTAANGGSQISAETKVNGNVTYYAHWISKITFSANGGSGGSTRSVASGSALGALPTPTRSGHTFDGWWTAANGGSQISAETKVNGNVTYYAHWISKITFSANGGSGGSTRSVASGSALGALPTPTRSGYSFAGWWTAKSGGSQISASTKANGDVTCYAHWVKITFCTVTFDARGGSLNGASKTRSLTSGSAVGELPTPTHASVVGSDNTWDYEFIGWYTAPNQGGSVDSGTIVTSDVTYYACWGITCHGYVPISYDGIMGSKDYSGVYSYPIIIDAGGGDGYPRVAGKWSSGKYVLPQCPFTRKGYVFAGWAMFDRCYWVGGDTCSWMCQSHDKVTIGSGYRGIYAAGAKIEMCGTTALVAQWRKGTSVRLTVKPNSTKYGTASGGGSYSVGAAATLTAKAKKGYAFAGWFKDKSCKTALNPNGYDNRNPTVKYTIPSGDTTVYAKFVTKSSAKKSLKFSSATKKLAKTPKKVQTGKSLSLALGISSATLVKVTAKGLPKGLSIDKRTGKITGTPTKAGTYTVTVTVKDAAGNKITQKVKITVFKPAVPDKIVGTYYGNSEFSTGHGERVVVTVSLLGKVSAKVGSMSFSGKIKRDEKGYYVFTTKKGTSVIKFTIDSMASWTNDALTGQVSHLGKIFARKNAASINAKAKELASNIAGIGSMGLYCNPYVSAGRIELSETQTRPEDDVIYVKAYTNGKVTLSGRIRGSNVSGTSYLEFYPGIGVFSHVISAGVVFFCRDFCVYVTYTDIESDNPVFRSGTVYRR